MERMFLLAVATMVLAAAGHAWAGDLWVSPDGDDADPGTKARPLRTLDGARRAVRRDRRRGRQPLTVALQSGVYYLPETVVFEAGDSGTEDAPITYAAADGAKVVLSGGQRVRLDWKPYRDGILKAAVPEGFTSDQLFVDGERRPMARFPNHDPEAQYFGGFSPACTSADRVKRWSDPAGGFVHAMHRSLWGDMHWRITGKKGEKLQMVGGWQNNRQMGAHRTYRFVENVFEELDAPGEWFLDTKRRVLYFFPPKGLDVSTAKVEAVRLRHLVAFRGGADRPVRHVRLRGLTLTHAARTFMENKEPLLRSDWTTYRGGAVLFDGAEDCGLEGCFLDQVGGNAVFVNGYNRRVSIVGCHIADAGASGVSFVGDPNALRSPLFEYHQTQTLEAMDRTPGPKTPDYPADCLVEECLIYRNGRVEKQTAGVNICMADSITVRHCSVYDCPRAGINVCDGAFGGHRIEFNDVFDTVKETGDHGSFNSWGRDRFWHPNRGTTAEWVRKHPDMPTWDCRKTIVLRNNRWRCDHGWDIDLDDGSSNYELTNNLCLAGGIKLREGYDRTVTNNILVEYTFCPHVWYPDSRSRFQRNIVWRETYAPAGMRKTDQREGVDYNLVHERGATPRPAEKLREFGGDEHSVVADAMFVDPLAGDYRVKAGSPALKLGFENFPMDRFGVTRPELRKIARTPPLPGTLEAAGVRSGGWGRRYGTPKTARWLGAKIKSIDSRGEMSAVGLGDRNGVLVVDVPAGSPAARAGLKANDVIRAVNGRGVKDLAAFSAAWRQAGKGGISLTIWREQKETELTVQQASHRADWLHRARWGVMTHYLGAAPSSRGGAELTAEMWNRRIDAFDVDALAEQVASTGARYLLFTIGQNSGHYCSPNAAYDKVVGIRPSKCSRRDLIADLSRALKKHGLRLLVYLPSGAPAADPVARKKLQWRWGRKGGWQLPGEAVGGRLVEFQRHWEAIVREWSLRWGTHVAGWWIDGAYFPDQMYRFPDPPNFASFAAALRAGNPEAIVAFNPGVRVPVIVHTSKEDYTAGEVNLPQLPKAVGACEGRFLARKGVRVQFQILTFLGKSWCRGDRPQWPDEKVIPLVRELTGKGGAVTFDVPITEAGAIPEPFVEQLRAIGRGLEAGGAAPASK